MSKPIAIVTGASAGIGQAISEELARKGYDLILGARRTARLHAIQENLSKDHPSCTVKVFELDVCSTDSCQVFFDKVLPSLNNRRVCLVNNAGLALGTDSLDKGSLSDWECVLDTNVMGVLRVLRLFLPNLIKSSEGGDLVFLSSVAAHEAYAGGGVYCASKHALRAIVKTLRLELCGHTHLRVLSIDPGMVETEFSNVRFKGDIDRAKLVYSGLEPLKAKDIASAVGFALSCPDYVNIDEMKIMPTSQASTFKVHRTNTI